MITAILLAAGASRRFGDSNKLLAHVGDDVMVAKTARIVMRCRVQEIIVVTGPDADPIRASIEHALNESPANCTTKVRFVANPNCAEGIGTSIATGITALDIATDGALVVLGDMPAVQPVLIDAVIARFEAMRSDRVTFPATLDGRQMNPVLWPRRCFEPLRRLTGDRGGKAMITAEGERGEPVLWPNEATFADIDTEPALKIFKDHSSSKS